MVRIFRITRNERFSGGDSYQTQWLYQTDVAYGKQWKTKKNGGYAKHVSWRVELVAEEVINGQWVEIDRWNNGKP